ncbi:hypothetical protein [Gemmiger formicilis]|uniref:hypothetical protein n=1 Tax=Gemmiger formicilis TaxID=745368 RepID=UPI00307D2475
MGNNTTRSPATIQPTRTHRHTMAAAQPGERHKSNGSRCTSPQNRLHPPPDVSGTVSGPLITTKTGPANGPRVSGSPQHAAGHKTNGSPHNGSSAPRASCTTARRQ